MRTSKLKAGNEARKLMGASSFTAVSAGPHPAAAIPQSVETIRKRERGSGKSNM